MAGLVMDLEGKKLLTIDVDGAVNTFLPDLCARQLPTGALELTQIVNETDERVARQTAIDNHHNEITHRRSDLKVLACAAERSFKLLLNQDAEFADCEEFLAEIAEKASLVRNHKRRLKELETCVIQTKVKRTTTTKTAVLLPGEVQVCWFDHALVWLPTAEQQGPAFRLQVDEKEETLDVIIIPHQKLSSADFRMVGRVSDFALLRGLQVVPESMWSFIIAGPGAEVDLSGKTPSAAWIKRDHRGFVDGIENRKHFSTNLEVYLPFACSFKGRLVYRSTSSGSFFELHEFRTWKDLNYLSIQLSTVLAIK